VVNEILKYAEEQLKKGYKPAAIRQALLREGYSPTLVDGVLESVQRKTTSGKGISLGTSREKSAFPKLILILLFLVVAILGAVFVPDLIKGKQPLLDIVATPDKFTYEQGEDLGFDLEIINMGSAERFDMVLDYRLLDEGDNKIVGREETLAISTSTSHHRNVELPDNLAPGDYVLKVFANYEGKIATSSFSFKVKKKTDDIGETGTCYDGIRNQDETGPDCGGACGGYWYDNECHPKPKEQPGPGPQETCEDGVRNQNEHHTDCGGACKSSNGDYWYDSACHKEPEPDEPQPLEPHEQGYAEKMMNARAAAQTNPAEAKAICLSMDNSDDKDNCLKIIAQISMKKEYCELVQGVEDRDLCYFPFFMQGDYSVCDKLTDPDNKAACEQLRDLNQLGSS